MGSGGIELKLVWNGDAKGAVRGVASNFRFPVQGESRIMRNEPQEHEKEGQCRCAAYLPTLERLGFYLGSECSRHLLLAPQLLLQLLPFPR
jgi:hypothetical protein